MFSGTDSYTIDRMVIAPKINIQRLSRDRLRVDLSGTWRKDTERDETAFWEALADAGRGQAVDVHAVDLEDWDSTLIVFLRTLRQWAQEADVAVALHDLPSGAERLLQLADHVPASKGMNAGSVRRRNIWVIIGERAVHGWRDAVAAVGFLGELTLAGWALLRGRARFRRSEFWAIVQECGPEALPIISLISLLVGMILAFLGAVQLKAFGAEVFIADAVAVGMVREMGALMTGILMAGRTGAAFAARLGTMQVNEEIDALQTMGFSPMEFLVLPRALALIGMMPLLTIYANLVGILGGALIGVWMLDLTATQYYVQTVNAVSLQAVVSGLIKSAVFGVLVALSGCLQGMRCGRSASAVGEATTAAVVNAIVYIVVADSLISIIYVITGF